MPTLGSSAQCSSAFLILPFGGKKPFGYRSKWHCSKIARAATKNLRCENARICQKRSAVHVRNPDFSRARWASRPCDAAFSQVVNPNEPTPPHQKHAQRDFFDIFAPFRNASTPTAGSEAGRHGPIAGHAMGARAGKLSPAAEEAVVSPDEGPGTNGPKP